MTVTNVFLRKINNKILSLERCSPSAYYTCQWQKRHGVSLHYVIYRWLHLLVFGTAVCLSLSGLGRSEASSPLKWPIYLTNWALLLYTVEAATGAKLVTVVYLAHSTGETLNDNDLACNIRVYGALHSTAVVVALGVTSIYWIFVYDPEIHKLDLVNIAVHAGNSIFMLLDLVLVAHTMKIKNILYPPLFTLVYIIFNFFYYICGGTDRKGNTYVYKVLDWRHPLRVFLFIFGGLIFLVMLNLILWYLAILRRKLCASFKRSNLEAIPQEEPLSDIRLA